MQATSVETRGHANRAAKREQRRVDEVVTPKVHVARRLVAEQHAEALLPFSSDEATAQREELPLACDKRGIC